MKILPIYYIFLIAIIMSCTTDQPQKKTSDAVNKNPLLSEFDTPFGIPPFDEIKTGHYLPAVKEAIKKQKEEIKDIVEQKSQANFENTLVALDNSGQLLDRVEQIFDNLNSAQTNDTMQALAKEIAPLISAQRDAITMNSELFKRIKFIYDNTKKEELTPEQYQLLDKIYTFFVRGGANLNEQDKKALSKINSELEVLKLKFSENVLKETNAFELYINEEKDLAGLPQNVKDAAKLAAKENGNPQKWLFTIHKPSLIPFLQYSERRGLREKMFKAYINKGDNDNEFDNKKNIQRIVELRIKKANLLGYQSHADIRLLPNMAKSPHEVNDFLMKLWEPALVVAKQEAAELQDLIKQEGESFQLQPWDWWYYAEKLRQQKYNLNEESLRPYFELNNVISGAFMVANKLYGITINELKDVPVYHKDVKAFEVTDESGQHVGVLFMDFHPRPEKRGGAWMSSFRKQSKRHGKNITPIIYNVCNFSKPTETEPALLSFEEVNTLYHEFGHALHGLLSKCTYHTLSGTSVARDFVELPSQIMENWAADKDVLKLYARHYKTGEPIPDELIEKLEQSKYFNQGFATVEYLSACLLDLEWATLKEVPEIGVNEFENKSLEEAGLIPQIVVRYRSTYFNHVFNYDYSMGYYSYIWAEVLDADAFQAFKETSVFDKKTATLFKENILEKGGSEDPMELYIKFRGRKPEIKALLKKRGLDRI